MRRWIVPGLLVLSGAAGCDRGAGARPSGTAVLAPDALAQPAEGRGTASPAPAIPPDAPLVVFLGDSITAGLHLDSADSFPAVVQRELAAAGHPFRLVNAGISGDTSAGGLRRIDWLLGQD